MDITSKAKKRRPVARPAGASVVVLLVLLGLGSAACTAEVPRAASGPTPTTTALPSADDATAPAGGVPPLRPTMRSPAPATPGPGPATTAANFADPVNVASRYVQATCTFDWREPYGKRERRSAAYLTGRAARSAAPSAAGRTDWERDVIRRELSGACRVTAAQVLDEAPNTATTRYVDVVAVREIRARGEAVKRDQAEYTYILVRGRGRWLVDGATAGG